MLQLLAARGAVGDICLHYYDAAGKPVLSQDEDPVIGMELEQIRRCPQVIAGRRRTKRTPSAARCRATILMS
jgi:DNA-binding transcriptional regulator LsrR (DeoR family)